AAVTVALEAVADGDHRRREGAVPVGELPHVALFDAANPRGVGQREAARQRHVLVEALHVALDERAVERALPLELGGNRPRQHDVGPGTECDVEVSLLGDLRAPRVDDDQLGAFAPTRRSGVLRRPSPCTKPGYASGTFAHRTPAVYGFAREPRIERIRSSSTVTVRLQVSGQSRGQTLGSSAFMSLVYTVSASWER